MKDELKVLQNAIINVLQCDISELEKGTRFEGDLGADSLDAYQIMSLVQEELGIELDPDKVEKIVTVDDAHRLILDAIDTVKENKQ